MNPDAALDFLEFVTERHRIWEARQRGDPQPWTDHPVLSAHKFTNVFRVLDPGTQFLLEELYDPEADARTNLMRFFLYRHTGRVEVWEYVHMMMGKYPRPGTLLDTLSVMKQYRELTKRPVFTNAYLVFPQSAVPGTDKLDSIFGLTARLFNPSSEDDIVHDFLAATTQAGRFHALRRNKGVADFMSMQILTDWGYTTPFREDDFLVCGPGAVKGAKALDSAQSAGWVHLWAVDAIRALPDVPLLAGRPPSWMDVQNCMCEFSKFVRYTAAGKSGVRYTPAHPGPQPKPTLPPEWTSS